MSQIKLTNVTTQSSKCHQSVRQMSHIIPTNVINQLFWCRAWMFVKLLLLLLGYMFSKPARFAPGAVFRFRASPAPPADKLDELMEDYLRKQASAANQSDTGNAVQPTGDGQAFTTPRTLRKRPRRSAPSSDEEADDVVDLTTVLSLSLCLLLMSYTTTPRS